MRSRDELEFDRLFALCTKGGRFEPNTDVHLDEADRSIVVHVELAGADAESLRVAVDESLLFIAGVRQRRDLSRHASLLRKEIQYGEFVTRVRLPAPIDEEGVTAVYRDGILTIRLPLAKSQRFPLIRTELRMTVKRTPA